MSKISLLKHILDTDRKILNSDIFGEGTKVSLLHFIGAEHYLITDFGAIWHRDKIFPNKYNRVPKGYLPLVVKDRVFPFPWVLIPTSAGKIWFPINQLLGWSFDPPCSTKRRYFLPKSEVYVAPCMLEDFHWTDKIPEVKEPSVYLDFVNNLYN